MAYTKISGIYLINCTATKKVYVGSAVSVRGRLAVHRSMLNRRVHTNKHLQNSFDKYGAESFVMEMIEECKPEDRIQREQAWIDYYDASNPEYGMNNSATATTSEGFRHSEATKAKLSALGKKRTHPHLLAYAKSLIGKPAANKGMKGTPWTDEQRAAASLQRTGRAAWNKGGTHTDEAKRKIAIGGSLALTKYDGKVAALITAMRSAGATWKAISEATGVSLSQCCKIGSGKRLFETIQAGA